MGNQFLSADAQGELGATLVGQVAREAAPRMLAARFPVPNPQRGKRI